VVADGQHVALFSPERVTPTGPLAGRSERPPSEKDRKLRARLCWYAPGRLVSGRVASSLFKDRTSWRLCHLPTRATGCTSSDSYIMRHLERVTEIVRGDAETPVWSPTGREIAFVDYSNDGLTSRLSVVPAAGGRPRVLVTADRALSHPSWSPDGKRIAFMRCRTGHGTWLSTANRDGSDLRDIRLIALRRNCVDALISWSPDGTEIALIVQGDFATGPLQAISTDGANQRIILRNSRTGCCSLSWQPRR